MAAQNSSDGQTNETVVEQGQKITPALEQRAQINYDAYILGPGDGLQIELLDLQELSGDSTIGPDGTLYLPRLELFMWKDHRRGANLPPFSTYVHNPRSTSDQLHTANRVYVGGEVDALGTTPLALNPNSALVPNQLRTGGFEQETALG